MFLAHFKPLWLLQIVLPTEEFQRKPSFENVDNFSVQAMAIDGCEDTTLC